jgi:DNA segregation ATPase FtsK/SpoIIIE, S-DNA-T family
MLGGRNSLRRRNRKSFIENVISYKREIIGILLVSFSVFISLSLFSFDPKDNCFFYFSTSNVVTQNWCGFLGAQVAGFCIYFLGSAAFLLIPIMFFLAFLFLFKVSFFKQLDRILAAFLLLITTSAILNFHKIDFLGLNPGGRLGLFLTHSVGFLLGKIGTIIVFYTLVWVACSLIFRVSFLSIFIFCAHWVAIISRYAFGKLKTASLYLFRKIFKKDEDLLWQASEKINEDVDASQQSEVFENLEETYEEDIFWREIQKEKSDDVCEDVGEELFKNLDLEYWKKNKVYNASEKRRKLFGIGILCLRNSVIEKNIFDALSNFSYMPPVEEKILVAKKPKRKVAKFDLPDPNMFGVRHKKAEDQKIIEQNCQERAQKLQEKLAHFGIEGKITAIHPGPAVTLFEYKPAIGTKISKIISLEDDLAMVLKAVSIRIIAPIPGRSVIGFEISNQNIETVVLSDVLASTIFKDEKCVLPLALGVDIVGTPIVEDLLKMPHLLIAGSTGSGKSVGLNVMLMSLLCKLKPSQLKLILVDPKRLEFAAYRDIPHLLFPILTDPRKVPLVLKWIVQEMERRYEVMSKYGVRNLEGYNEQRKNLSSGEELEEIPFIIVMIDELADLMIVAGKDVEIYITRIAQMARAAGIHMIIATQRPSVDVLTGLIKVNFPSRIAFRVSSKIDSKTILDTSGAERLLGRGDMLYLNPRLSDIKRVHGAYASNDEIGKMTDFLRSQFTAEYLDIDEIESSLRKQELERYDDELLDDIVDFVKTIEEVSISMLQRRYRIGFNRSARIIDELEIRGMIAPSQGSKPRKVLR